LISLVVATCDSSAFVESSNFAFAFHLTMNHRSAAALLFFYAVLPLRAEEPTITIKKPGVAFPPELDTRKVALNPITRGHT
jgi:hypothetical protein